MCIRDRINPLIHDPKWLDLLKQRFQGGCLRAATQRAQVLQRCGGRIRPFARREERSERSMGWNWEYPNDGEEPPKTYFRDVPVNQGSLSLPMYNNVLYIQDVEKVEFCALVSMVPWPRHVLAVLVDQRHGRIFSVFSFCAGVWIKST